MTPKAILFDLDGTLLDTLRDLADAMNEVLAAEGRPPHPVDAYRMFVGDGVRTLVSRALAPRIPDDAALEAGVRAFLDAYGRRWRDHTRPYPGVAALLDGLFERGLQVAIFSNKPEGYTRLTVEAFLGRWSFGEVRGARPDVPVKPDPTGALEIAAHLGVAPGACVFCGDTGVDMATGRRAGMVPVGVLWGFRERAELEEAGARAMLERPEEILAFLDPQ